MHASRRSYPDDAPPEAPAERRIVVLGSTGSIGRQTLDVVRHLNDLHARGRWPTYTRVVGLAAGKNSSLLAQQADAFGVTCVALSDTSETPQAHMRPRDWLVGPDAAEELVRHTPCELVVAAIVGSAGLPATLAAVELGRDVALANKETLVAAGELVVGAARRSGSRLLPVDSEHSGVWQCLGSHVGPPTICSPDVACVTLTASGGPFRTWARDRIHGATPDEALRHPTWRMGEKVTVDSASLMNKALELIEAHWLFGLGTDRLRAVVHPQSIVHAMVEFADGSVVAQMGVPDMRGPIQHALAWPARAPACAPRLELSALSGLEFEEPDVERFPALGLAADAIVAGGTAGAVLNAANEAAVGAFLASRSGEARIPFGLIAELVAGAMSAVAVRPLRSLKDALDAESAAQDAVRSKLPIA